MTQKEKIKELENKIQWLELEVQMLKFQITQQNPIIVYPREIYPPQPYPSYPWTYPNPIITYDFHTTC